MAAAGDQLSYSDAYARSIIARVRGIEAGDPQLLILDRTVFYPGGVGQPGGSELLEPAGHASPDPFSMVDRWPGSALAHCEMLPAPRQMTRSPGAAIGATIFANSFGSLRCSTWRWPRSTSPRGWTSTI